MLVSNQIYNLFLQFIDHPLLQPMNFGRFIGLYFGMLMITKSPGCECFHDGPLGAGGSSLMKGSWVAEVPESQSFFFQQT